VIDKPRIESQLAAINRMVRFTLRVAE
jgi:hypothetical protein